jgi:hypothetical protein
MRQTEITFSYLSSATTSTEPEAVRMLDLVFIVITILFFLVALAYVQACEKLR